MNEVKLSAALNGIMHHLLININIVPEFHKFICQWFQFCGNQLDTDINIGGEAGTPPNGYRNAASNNIGNIKFL